MSWLRMVLAGCALTLASCGGRSVAPVGRAVVLTTRSAPVVRPPTLSCQGEGLCRETLLLDLDSVRAREAADELAADCAHLGGRSRTGSCPRHGVIASCAVDSGEHGPITVLAYGQDDDELEQRTVRSMAELCESFDGTFERAKDAATQR